MKKKKIITITVLFLLILILSFLIFTVFNIFYNKYSCEANYLDFANKNENVIFSINKCVLFSNCNAKNKTNSTTSFTIENLYQYTDIALFINNNSKENTLENTLKNARQVEVIHQLIRNNGQNFDISEEEIELNKKLN